MPTLRLHLDAQPPIEVPAPRALLGRDRACEIFLDDRSISRRHVAFELRGEAWALVDQGSVNGVFLDGKRVSDVPLVDGQTLRVGSLGFRVEVEPDVPQTVLIQAAEVDGDSTVVMSSPESPPTLGTVQIQVPSLAPPVQRAPASPPPAPAQSAAARAAAVAPRAPAPAIRPAAAAPAARAGAAASPAPAGGTDAWQLLGLAPGTPPAEVRARFDEVSRDLQHKLASAPTPALRATYEKNLATLERARQKLAPGAGEQLLRDLPSAQPTVDADLLDREEAPRRTPPEVAPAPVEAAPAKGRATLLPPATTVLVFLAAGLLAVSAYFALATGKLRAEIHKQEAAPELIAARQDAARYEPFAALLKGGALRNGRLRLCNRSARPLEIAWLSAVTVRKDDLPPGADPELASQADGFSLVTYNSSFCGRDFRISLPPGTEQTVELRSEEPRCRFDGKAIFYALSLQRPADAAPSPAPGARGPRHEAEPQEHPGDPGTTYWLSGLLGGTDQCVSVGAGW